MASSKDNSSGKSALLKKWLNRKKKTTESSSGHKGISLLPEGQTAPLSYGQQRLWFLQQLHPGNPFYHYTELYHLTGDLRIDLLEKSFQKIIGRHDILRSHFPMEQGKTIQQVQQNIPFQIRLKDISTNKWDNKQKVIQDLAREDATLSFDLSSGALLRILLIKFSPTEHYMVITMHHIITDKWSMEVLREELSQIYQAFLNNQSPKLPPLKIQYKDFAYWQQSQTVSETDLAYWKNKLQGDIPVTNLPTDFPRPLNPSYQGAYAAHKIPKHLAQKLQQLAKDTQNTMFTLMLTAFKVLLYRYTSQEDILVGTPFSNREQTDLEKVIGFFNETLVLRSEVKSSLSFKELLIQVRQNVLEAFNHKNVPLEVLIKTLQPERQPGVNPLFQTMFLYHKVPDTPPLAPNLQLSYAPFDLGVAKFDLTLYIEEQEDGLNTIFEYATDLFQEKSIRRIQNNLLVLLQSIVDDPDQAIGKLELIEPDIKDQILNQWNLHPTQTLPQKEFIYKYIEEQVKLNPQKPAVVYQQNQVTYEALDQKSNIIAAHLIHAGLKPNTPVGLYADRSLDLIIGILGILKAGGTYLPLDPEYPAERIQFMIQDTATTMILTQKHYLSDFKDFDMQIFDIQEVTSVHLNGQCP